MSLFELYLITTLPRIGELLMGATVLLSVALGITALVTFMAFIDTFSTERQDSYLRRGRYLGKRILIALFISAILSVTIPSERQLAMIAGGYIATNTEGVKELPDNLVKAANEFLESYYEKDAEKVTNR